MALNPLYGSMWGGTAVFIDICKPLEQSQQIQCKFGDKDVQNAKILGRNLAVCVSPLLQKTGYVALEVIIAGKVTARSQFLSSEWIQL